MQRERSYNPVKSFLCEWFFKKNVYNRTEDQALLQNESLNKRPKKNVARNESHVHSKIEKHGGSSQQLINSADAANNTFFSI